MITKKSAILIHIEFGRDETDDNYGKKVGVPHLVSPGWFGGYNCMSGNTPSMLSKKNNGKANDFMDWGSADFIKGCGSCHMGGGFAEKDRDGLRYDQKADASIKALDGDYYTVLGRGTAGATGTTTGTTGGTPMAHSAKAMDHDASGSTVMGKAANGTVDTLGFDTIVQPWDWKKSGVVEIDCVSCHYGLNELKKFPASGLGADDGKVIDNDTAKANSDNSATALQAWGWLRDGQANPNKTNSGLIYNGFFREASTAFLEFVNLKMDDPNGLQLVTFKKKNITQVGTPSADGKTTAYKNYFELELGSDGRPIVQWNPKAFDADGKVTIPLKRFTPNENCMNCHTTAKGRRGFFGFGDVAKINKDPDGLILSDYKDDVHKGKGWTAPNGVTRRIDNCNACHSYNYFNTSSSTPELDSAHQFPKGNSDFDVRNDLDYNDNVKTCTYCHDKSTLNPDPVLPSGHETLLKAHEELWKTNGDMAGYSKETLTKITKTHMDVVACQTCHIVEQKDANGKKLVVLYQYKKQDDGKLKITPMNPGAGVRLLWRDRKSDKVLSRLELAMVYKDAPKDAAGLVSQGIIINALDGSELGRVGKTGAAYDAPRTYEQFMALKTAYDKLMEKRGFPGTDMQMVWGMVNAYQMNHGTDPSDKAMPCGECHTRKQSGAWSALIAPDSVLGDQGPKNLYDVAVYKGTAAVPSPAWVIPDQRLLDEGHVRFDSPYFKRDPKTGNITIRTGDVLNATKIDPFTAIAKNSSATHIFGDLRSSTLGAVLGDINMFNDPYRQALEAGSGKIPVFYFNTSHGTADLSNAAVVALGGGIADLVLPQYRLTADVYSNLPDGLVKLLESKVAGSKLTSSAYWFHAKDRQNQTVTQFTAPVYVKMPYKGKATSAAGIRVLSSVDGSVINQLDAKAIVDVKADNDEHAGYIIFQTTQFSWFAILDV
ncbi:MAG: hypothetical protein ABL903_07540 [Methylococcales bacterium]